MPVRLNEYHSNRKWVQNIHDRKCSVNCCHAPLYSENTVKPGKSYLAKVNCSTTQSTHHIVNILEWLYVLSILGKHTNK